MAWLPWPPVCRAGAVNLGFVQISGQSGGSVNFGVASVREGGGGGGSSSQLVGIAGDGGLSWINVGVLCTCPAEDGAGGASGRDGQGAGSASPGQVPGRQAAAGTPPATFRFRWDDPGAEVRTGSAVKGGRHGHRPSAAPRGSGEAARTGRAGGAAR